MSGLEDFNWCEELWNDEDFVTQMRAKYGLPEESDE